MKYFISTFLYLFFSLQFGISQVSYQGCSNCPQAANSNDSINTPLYSYGNSTPFNTGHIESDFDLRVSTGNSRWHKGLDLRDHGSGADQQRGDGIVSPEAGAIVNLTHTGYKYIVIQGNNQNGNNFNYGYGHIFSHYNISTTSMWRSGNFVLKLSEPDAAGDQYPCIINLNNCKAYSTEDSLMVVITNNSHCSNDTMYSTNEIGINEVFAPIGGSRTSTIKDFPVHLHLYKFRNTTNGITEANCMDPSVDLQNPNTSFIIHKTFNKDIELNSFSNWDISDLIYPGTQYNTIGLRIEMENAIPGVDSSRYSNVMHDLDSIQVLICEKRPNSDTAVIKGPTYKSEFLLGANEATPLYPNNIHDHYGSKTITGISPYAYRDNIGFNPYDNYYFADFVTRIHKLDPMDGPPTQIANLPGLARYNDGRYKLFAKVTNVRGNTYTSDTLQFVLDNFKPYIHQVVVRVGNKIILQEYWKSVNQQSEVELSNLYSIDTISASELNEHGIRVFAYSSEPLDSLRLDIPYFAISNAELKSTTPDNTGWDFHFKVDSISSDTSFSKIVLEFSGFDQSDLSNKLIDLSPWNSGGQNVSIPTREANNQWLDNNTPKIQDGVDKSFDFGLECKQSLRYSSDVKLLSVSGDCLTSGSIEGTIIDATCHDHSDGSVSLQILDCFAPYEYYWSNGEETKDISGLLPGEYTVTVNDVLCSEAIKTFTVGNVNEFDILVKNKENVFECDGDAYLGLGSIDIEISTPGVYTYQWYGPSGFTSTMQDIQNLYPGSYFIQVTKNGICSKSKSITICCCEDSGLQQDPSCYGYEGEPTSITVNGQITPESSQGSYDGSIELEIVEDFNELYFYWEGPNNYKSGNEDINNLTAGIYNVTISEGCISKELSFEVPICDELLFISDVEIEPTCPNQNEGSIKLISIDDNLDFVWSTGSTESFIDELYSGTYFVTVSTDVYTGCTQVFEYDVEEKVSQGDLAFSYIGIHEACAGQSNGSITTNVVGGFYPYSYEWSDGSNAQYNYNLSAGIYYLTVTDDCGNQLIKDFEVEEFPGVEITAIFSEITCEGNGFIDLSIVSGMEPFTFSWSNGATTEDIYNLNEGDYTVNITDGNNCVTSFDFHVETMSYILNTERACENINNGSLHIEIENPNAELINVFINDVLFDETYEDPIAHVDIDQLSPFIEYVVDIQIGNCGFEPDTIILYSDDAEIRFDTLIDELCIYNSYCGDDKIGDSTWVKDIVWNYGAAKGAILNCFVPGYCEPYDHIAEKHYDRQWVSGLEFQLILQNAYSFNPFYVSTLIEQYNYINPCDRVWYCPATLTVAFHAPGLTVGYDETNSYCYHLECMWPFPDEDFCICDILPDYIGCDVTGGPQFDICNIQGYPLIQIIEWHQQISNMYGELYTGTELYNLVESCLADENMLIRARCSNVIFCETDFRILGNDLDFQEECVGCLYSHPNLPKLDTISTCDITYSSDYYIVRCLRNCGIIDCETEWWKLCDKTYHLINYEFSGFGYRGRMINSNILLSDVCEDEKFNRIINLWYKDKTFPKALIERNGKSSFLDYGINIPKMEFEDLDENISQLIFDGDLNQLVYINNLSNRSIEVVNSGPNSNWSTFLTSDNKIDVNNLTKSDNGYIIDGVFQGDIYYNTNHLSNSNEEVVFVLVISPNGEISDFYSLSGYDQVFTGSNNTLIFTPLATTLSINGVVSTFNENSIIPVVLDDISLSVKESTFYYDGTIQLLDAMYNKNSQSGIIIGEGNLYFNDSTYQIRNTQDLTIFGTSQNISEDIWQLQISYTDSIDFKSIQSFSDSLYSYFGLNFFGNLNIGNEIITSNGIEDFILIKISNDGSYFGYNQIGTTETEHLSDIVVVDSLIYMGGELSGSLNSYEIGSTIFIPVDTSCLSRKAFMTTTSVFDFTELGSIKIKTNETDKKMNKDLNSDISNFEYFQIYPNPFTNSFVFKAKVDVDFEYYIKITDLLGRVAYNSKVDLHKGENIRKIDLTNMSIPSGLYLFEVTKSQNEKAIFTSKIVKD